MSDVARPNPSAPLWDAPIVAYNPLAELESKINTPTPDRADVLQQAVNEFAAAWKRFNGPHDPTRDYSDARKQVVAAESNLLALAAP